MNLGLTGKIIGISGAGSTAGIGFAAARALLEEGAKLFFCDINEAAVKEVGAKLSAYGEVLPLVCDVSSKSSVDEMFEAATAHYGRVDVWINNAGIYPQKMLMDTDPRGMGPFDGHQPALGAFVHAGGGAACMEGARGRGAERGVLCGGAGQRRQRGVRRVEVRRAQPDQDLRRRARPPRHPRLRLHPRRHCNRR